MRTPGTPHELALRRKLAVQRINEGYSPEDVAEILGVDPSSVRRWVLGFRRGGPAALAARAVPGRPAKLSIAQEKIIRRWLRESPSEHGFATDLWCAPRLAQLIRQEFQVSVNPRYLCAWLRQRGYTPQKPRRIARERDEAAIARWRTQDWPRIQKKPADAAPA